MLLSLRCRRVRKSRLLKEFSFSLVPGHFSTSCRLLLSSFSPISSRCWSSFIHLLMTSLALTSNFRKRQPPSSSLSSLGPQFTLPRYFPQSKGSSTDALRAHLQIVIDDFHPSDQENSLPGIPLDKVFSSELPALTTLGPECASQGSHRVRCTIAPRALSLPKF